jgi:sugar diacid utilization regulator
VRERAALRARQLFPLEGLLELHNLGQRAIWDALWATRAPTPAGARAATSLIPFTFDFAIAVNGAVVDGYLRERSFGLVDVARARREALEVLLTKDGASYDDVAGLATSLGIRFGEEHVMIAAAASGAGRELTPERLRQSAELLGRRTNARAEQPFTVVRHDEIVTIVGLEGREPSSVAGAIAQAADEAAHRYGVHLVAGVSSAFRAPDQLGSAYAQSRRALVHASSRGCALALQQVGVFDELVASAGPIALTVIPDGVRAFLGEDSRNGGTLVRTLLSYAEANLSVGGTAQKLSVHPNTVHYRLKRIKKLSGKEPRHLPELVELVTAVRLLGNHAE